MPSNPEVLGTLVVVVLKARNLHDKHSLYKQDVFTEVKFSGSTKRTHVDVRGGQHPLWDEELRFPVFCDPSDNNRMMQVACYAKEPKSEDLLGKGTINITDTLRSGEFDDWVALGIDNVVRGEIYLEMTYFISTPTVGPRVPLARRPSKLPPSDRLSQPPYQARKPFQANQGRKEHVYLSPASPPSSHSSAASHHGKDLPPPPIPAGIHLGAVPSYPSNHIPTLTVPASLRPGRPNVLPTDPSHPYGIRSGLSLPRPFIPLAIDNAHTLVTRSDGPSWSTLPRQISVGGIVQDCTFPARYESPLPGHVGGRGKLDAAEPSHTKG
ncbi:hypothetical protein AX17_006575 [Amanita inopinata Kibby_2008]|nr:hypothetical protein AX17_006575 [Amanita inopinata Kibby_2008]